MFAERERGHHPWATLVVIGAERIETRGWATGFRGTLAIHASLKFPNECRALCQREPFRSALAAAGVRGWHGLVPTLGHVLGTARLVHAFRFDGRNLPPREHDFGDYSRGRWGFVLEDARRLAVPVKARGALNLWRWNPPAWPLRCSGGASVPRPDVADPADQLDLFVGQLRARGRAGSA